MTTPTTPPAPSNAVELAAWLLIHAQFHPQFGNLPLAAAELTRLAGVEAENKLFRDRNGLFAAWKEATARAEKAEAERDYYRDLAEREREQRQKEVGAQEYSGNTVSYIYDKAKCYGDMVHGCVPALREAGFPVDENSDSRASAIANSVKAMSAQLAAQTRLAEKLREALMSFCGVENQAQAKELLNLVEALPESDDQKSARLGLSALALTVADFMEEKK